MWGRSSGERPKTLDSALELSPGEGLPPLSHRWAAVEVGAIAPPTTGPPPAQGGSSHMSQRSRASSNAMSSSRRSGLGSGFVVSPPRRQMACKAGVTLAKMSTLHRW